MQPARSRRFDQFDVYVAGLLLVQALLVASALTRAPRNIGVFQDDALYLANAKSLADGQGYRHPHLPGEPYQTKYPILYPLLLSAVWRIWPDFPANIAVMQVLNTALWAGGSWLACVLARRVWGLPWWLPAIAVSFAFLHPLTLGLLQTTMSEPLFLFLSMAALLACAAGNERRNGAVRGAWAGLLAGLAYLTRVIGIAVMAAVLADLALRRRWRALLSAAVLTLAAFAGWQVWRAHAAAANAQSAAAGVLAYELDYSIWFPHGFNSMGRVALNNAAVILADNLTLMLSTAGPAIAGMMQRQEPNMLLLHAALVVGLLVSLIGSVATWRSGQRLLHLYLAFTLVLIVVWPFQPSRFLLPILPLTTTLFLAGCLAIMRWLGSFFSQMTNPEHSAAAEPSAGSQPVLAEARCADRRRGIVSTGLTVVLSLGLLWPCVRVVVAQSPAPSQPAAVEETIEQLRQRTAPDAVICADVPAYMYLRTGRKCVPFVPWTNPLYLYPDDRPLGGYGRVIPRGEMKAWAEHLERDLLPFLRATGVTHIVPLPESTTGGVAFREFRLKHPGLFRLVATFGKDSLYKFADQ